VIGTKTRIWRGGMNEIMRPAREGQPDTDAAPVAQAAPQPEPSAAPSEPPSPSARPPAVQTQVMSQRKPRVGSSTLVGHVFDLSALLHEKSSEPSSRKSSPMTTTRLVPIEELLAGRARPEPAPAEASESHPRARGRAVDGPSSDFGVEQVLGLSKRRLTGEHVRRGLIAVLLPLTIWVFVNRQGGNAPVASLPQPAAEQPVASSRVIAPSAPSREQPPQAAAPSIPVNAPVSTSVPSARQRAAVDALVAGDFVSARRLYGELAASTDVGDPKVFVEAARILDERMRTTKN